MSSIIQTYTKHLMGQNALLMLQVDKMGNIVNCSNKLLGLLNYNKKELLKVNIKDIIDFTTDKYKFEDIKKIINQSDNSFSSEHRMICSDKKYIYVCAQYWYEGEYLFINFIDISKNIKKEIKPLNKYLLNEKVLNEIDFNIGIFDKNGEFIYCNQAMKGFLEEIEFSYFESKGINLFGSAIATRINEVLKNTNLKYEFEHCFELKKRDMCFHIVIQGLEKDKCSIFMSNIQKEKTYYNIIDTAKAGIVFEGEEGITYLNSSAYEILELNNKTQFLYTRLVEYIDFEYKLKFLEEFYNPDKIDNMERIIRVSNKKDILIRRYPHSITIDGEEKKLYYLNEIYKDGEKKIYNDYYSEKNIDFIESNEYDRLKNEFFANISHELRTPINVIFSIVQLIESSKKELSIEQKKYNKILKQNCYRLLRLINNLIEITRIDAGHIRLSLGNYNMINIVEEITLSVAEYIESKGLKLIFDTEVEEKIMACDPEKIECVTLNLLANASKFTKPGDSIEVYIEEESNDWIKIRVKDTGQGIPKSKKEIIFKRFRQVDKSLYRAHEGSGIGLSLVKSFVELHGGEISVESEEGKGSEFTIRFPIRVVDEKSVKKVEHYNSDRVIDKINIEFSDIYFNE